MVHVTKYLSNLPRILLTTFGIISHVPSLRINNAFQKSRAVNLNLICDLRLSEEEEEEEEEKEKEEEEDK
jgi:hypothetical protein